MRNGGPGLEATSADRIEAALRDYLKLLDRILAFVEWDRLKAETARPPALGVRSSARLSASARRATASGRTRRLTCAPPPPAMPPLQEEAQQTATARVP